MILQAYAVASSQLINFDKSWILFSKKLEPGIRASISLELNVYTELDVSKYLGVPVLVGRK